jgi:hypothetical protein
MNFAALVNEEEDVVQGQTLSLETVRPDFTKYVVAVNKLVSDAKAITVKDDDSLKVAISIGGEAKKISKAIDAKYKEVTADAREFVKSVKGFCDSFTDNLDEAETITKKKIGDFQYQKELERRKQEEAARKAQQELQDRLNREAEGANRKAREEARAKAEAEAKIKREREEAEAKERGAKKAELEALAKKAEEERQAALKAAEEEAAKHTVEAPVVPDLIIQKDEKAVHTETGTSAHIRKVWKAEVVDGGLVPLAYCSPDQKKLNEAVKGGVRTIPGVRIWEDASTVLRT